MRASTVVSHRSERAPRWVLGLLGIGVAWTSTVARGDQALTLVAKRPERVPKMRLLARFQIWHCKAGGDPFQSSQWFHSPHGDPEFDLLVYVVPPYYRIELRGLNERDARRTTYAWVQGEMFTATTTPDNRASYGISAEPVSGVLMPYPIQTPLEARLFDFHVSLAEMAGSEWLRVEHPSVGELRLAGKIPAYPNSTIRATLDPSKGMVPLFVETRAEAAGIKPMWGQMRTIATKTLGDATIIGEATLVVHNPNVHPDYMVYSYRVMEASLAPELKTEDLRPPRPAENAVVFDAVRGVYREYDHSGRVTLERRQSPEQIAASQEAIRRSIAAAVAKSKEFESRQTTFVWGAGAAILLTLATFLFWIRRKRANASV